jgi:hypothetical protein
MRTVGAILILITDKRTMTFKKWRDNFRRLGVAPGRVDPSRFTGALALCTSRSLFTIVYQIMSANTKVTKTKTALEQETYNMSDLKHELHCEFVELGDSVSVAY